MGYKKTWSFSVATSFEGWIWESTNRGTCSEAVEKVAMCPDILTALQTAES